mmetsp:Transcript_16099/g.21153  ORF Transcript_16099/g.21153 Transcript_16099/m.21153 type:complete len:428 (-) Transcript_16099:2520-3803(-)
MARFALGIGRCLPRKNPSSLRCLSTLKSSSSRVETIRPELDTDFLLASGKTIPKESIQIKYSSYGEDPLKNKPILLLCPSMSNSVFAMDEEATAENGAERGWWRKVVGSGANFGIDIDKFQIICGAPLGSPFGSTSPLTINTDTGNPWGKAFPQVTPQDMAKLQALLLDHLGIEKVFAVIGGSMGGMQSLQFAANFPNRYDRFVSIAATAQTSPATVALRSVQRAAVRTDPEYKDGDYELGQGPKQGMAVARMFGTICYRSPEEFTKRFDWYPTVGVGDVDNVSFEVERYLQYQATKFVSNVNYDANCYLLLSKGMDMMDIGAGTMSFEDGTKRIPNDKQGLLLSYSTDRLTPAEDLERLSETLGRRGVSVHYEVLQSQFGHDAFLIESQAVELNMRLRAFLETDASIYGGHGVHNVRALVKELLLD